MSYSFGASLEITPSPNRRYVFRHKDNGTPYATLGNYPIFKRSSDSLFPTNILSQTGPFAHKSNENFQSPEKIRSRTGSVYDKGPFANVQFQSKIVENNGKASQFDTHKNNIFGTSYKLNTPFKGIAKNILS